MKRLLLCTAALFALFVVCGCMGFGLPLVITIELASGWIFFLRHLFAEMTVDWVGLATAAVCVILLAIGIHRLGNWLVGQRDSPKIWHLRWTLSLLALVVLTFAAGIAAVGLTHQTIWLATSPEPLFERDFRITVLRLQSMSNLKNIGVAAHEFAHKDSSKLFPQGGTFGKDGVVLHGWHTFLLPHMEQQELYKSIRLDLPWHHPENAKACKHDISFYRMTAGHDENGYPQTCYYGNVHLFTSDVRYGPETIPDGSSNTILAGEAGTNLKPWAFPLNWRDPARGINRHPDGFGSVPGVQGGATILMADGGVFFVSEKVSPEVLKARGTPAAGDPLRSLDDFDP